MLLKYVARVWRLELTHAFVLEGQVNSLYRAGHQNDWCTGYNFHISRNLRNHWVCSWGSGSFLFLDLLKLDLFLICKFALHLKPITFWGKRNWNLPVLGSSIDLLLIVDMKNISKLILRDRCSIKLHFHSFHSFHSMATHLSQFMQ